MNGSGTDSNQTRYCKWNTRMFARVFTHLGYCFLGSVDIGNTSNSLYLHSRGWMRSYKPTGERTLTATLPFEDIRKLCYRYSGLSWVLTSYFSDAEVDNFLVLNLSL